MFTVEFEKDYSVVTSMDEQNNHDDIQMYLENNGVVFLRQYVEEIDTHQVIEISYKQLLDLWTSMRQTEGLFKLELMIDYSISSLSKRIQELREQGFDILSVKKKHPITGQRYVRYILEGDNA